MYHHLQLVGKCRSDHRGHIQNFVSCQPKVLHTPVEKEVALSEQKSSLSNSLDLSPSSLNTEMCFISQEMELAMSPLNSQSSD
jgi:hypothetical protein